MSHYCVAMSVLGILVVGTTAPAQPADNAAAREALHEAAQFIDSARPWQISLCGDVAEVYQKLGDAKEAAAVVDKLRHKVKAQPPKIVSVDGPGTFEASILSKAYAGLGDAKNAIEVMANVKAKNELLQKSALEAAKAGQVQVAYQIADAIADIDDKSKLKTRIREDVLLRRVPADGAAEALQAVDQLPSAMAKVSMLVGHDMIVVLQWDSRQAHFLGTELFRDGIASRQLKAGNKTAARETALKALALLPSVEEAQRARAALVVVWLLTEMDDLGSARKAAMRSCPGRGTRKE